MIDRNCRAAFGEKSFVTAVIPGNGHRTAIPRTAFRAFVTVVAALFQELGVYCHAIIIAMRCILSICDCQYSSNTGYCTWHHWTCVEPLDMCARTSTATCHILAFRVCDCCDYTTPGNCPPPPPPPPPPPHGHTCISAIVIPRNGIINHMPRIWRELICDQGRTVVFQEIGIHQLPCHLDQIRLTRVLL